jgi:hypothetical protein
VPLTYRAGELSQVGFFEFVVDVAGVRRNERSEYQAGRNGRLAITGDAPPRPECEGCVPRNHTPATKSVRFSEEMLRRLAGQRALTWRHCGDAKETTT